jgi:hypothetical protein
MRAIDWRFLMISSFSGTSSIKRSASSFTRLTTMSWLAHSVSLPRSSTGPRSASTKMISAFPLPCACSSPVLFSSIPTTSHSTLADPSSLWTSAPTNLAWPVKARRSSLKVCGFTLKMERIHGTPEASNKALQPTALWRCASISVLISVFSTVAQPRSQSGG